MRPEEQQVHRPGAGCGPDDPITRGLGWFFSTWRFPAFALTLLALFTLALAALLLAPAPSSSYAAFAEEFRTWCFGWNAKSGTYEWASVVVTFSQPVILGGMIAAFWWAPLRGVLRERPRAFLGWFGVATVVATGAVGGLTLLGTPADATEPVVNVASLRTTLRPPVIELTAHTGEPVELAALRGKVVLITSIYSTCGYACPMIMAQVKRVVERVPEATRDDLRVLCITMDPETDTPERLREMASAQEVAAPLYQLATGPPAEVNRVLDALGVARKRDPETGVIDHVNLFIVCDRTGRIAHRFTMSEQQEQWLSVAIETLLAESP
jgi:protein SCO1/2